MKRELTLADIAGYLPHGLKVIYKNARHYGVFDIEIGKRRTSDGLCYYLEENELPVLRPMSDLCEEITERGYNDGKPFVPVKRLGELLGSDYEDCLILDCRIKYSPSEVWYSDMCAFFDLLHRLHFDYRDLIDAGLAVSVHDLPTNPYEP